MLDRDVCRRARLARDARFDGQFFTAVRTTGIYCRPICPATPPQEGNVEYYPSAIEAARAGYRPCLRCRPDSAPGSPAWIGTDTTLERALRLIDAGALQEASLDWLITDARRQDLVEPSPQQKAMAELLGTDLTQAAS